MPAHPHSALTLARIAAAALIAAATLPCSAGPLAAAADERWVAASPRDAAMAWAWDAREVQGPAGLRCGAPSHEFVRLPAQGLMQGTLGATPQDAERRARALGVRRFPVATHRINCDNATFDLHMLGRDRALIGWDGRVLALRRTAADASPLATVQRLLEGHLGTDMAHTPAHARALQRWMTPALNARISAYFARPRPRDEVPPINGDPYTNSQEEPDGVTLQPGPVQGDHATVVAHLAGAGRQWQLTYRLRRTGGQWRIDDIESPDGPRYAALLRQ
ncbi:MAG: DUF3828 domain-containing protein [Rubrivivax sp.]|nr:DUF3828 domain-containing protein [Rubrivivax sp.]